jgi:hypothetical protein
MPEATEAQHKLLCILEGHLVPLQKPVEPDSVSRPTEKRISQDPVAMTVILAPWEAEIRRITV